MNESKRKKKKTWQESKPKHVRKAQNTFGQNQEKNSNQSGCPIAKCDFNFQFRMHFRRNSFFKDIMMYAK